MILTALVGKFGLQEKVGARDDSGAIGSRQSFAYPNFRVMATLVGGVDAAKAAAQSEFRKGRAAIFFPCGAVEEGGDGQTCRGRHRGSRLGKLRFAIYKTLKPQDT